MKKVPLLKFHPPEERTLPLEVKRMHTLPAKATRAIPHRHTFYVIFWITAGAGKHYLDFVGDDIRPNSLHFVGPGQVHYWDVADDLEGTAVLFEKSLFLDPMDQHLLDQLTIFRTINGQSVLNPPLANIAWFQQTIARIEDEYSQEQFAQTPSILAWVRLLLIESQRLIANSKSVVRDVSAETQLANRYIDLVEQHAIEQHKVEWYAEQLAVTVAHLSKSVKNALSTTAGALLRQRLVLEAKRLLVHTDATAAAIAVQLNFEDASYFGRFFKRETNKTPRQFRTHIPKKYQI